MHAPHDHHHGPVNYNRAFVLGVGLNVLYIAVESSAGWWTGSLALLADAGHNASDVLGLLLAWGGYLLTRRAPTERYTYGLRSSSILAALFSGLLLLTASGGIVWEAVQRFREPQPLPGVPIMIVAAIGVLINGLTAALFFRGREADLNLRGAFLHMAADAIVSLAVVVSGLGIRLFQWPWIDPVTSLLVAAVILWSTWDLLRESVALSLHGVPKGINPVEIRQYLASLPGVQAVHDLHIWAMSTTETALTAHLVRPVIANDDAFLSTLAGELHERYGIGHSTIQIERNAIHAQCRLLPHDHDDHDSHDHDCR